MENTPEPGKEEKFRRKINQYIEYFYICSYHCINTLFLLKVKVLML